MLEFYFDQVVTVAPSKAGEHVRLLQCEPA